MEDLKQMCESYERVLKKRMEILPDYNLKDLRRVIVTDKGGPSLIQTGVKVTKAAESVKVVTVKNSKTSQKTEEKGDNTRGYL